VDGQDLLTTLFLLAVIEVGDGDTVGGGGVGQVGDAGEILLNLPVDGCVLLEQL
jgi:hypothetical protein